MYHSISGGRSALKISPSLFAEQVDWLRANARVVPLDEVADLLAGGRPLPDRAVVLTFDDGFADFYTDAAPILRRANLPATVFLTTGFCGRTNRWPGQPDWVEEQPLLSWDQVAELAQQGFAFGSHTVNHPALAEVAPEEAEAEIVQSKEKITARLGRPVELFCYPYGSCNAPVRAIAGRHYRAACSTQTALCSAADDLMLLPRVDAHLVRHPALFRRMFTSSFPLYLKARKKIRQLRGHEPRLVN